MFLRRRSKDRLAAVEELLEGYELPSFPQVITDAMGRLSDPDVSMSELVRVLELDPGISVKLLQMANSAAMGLRNPVDNLAQVVTILGRNQVESILISTAVRASVPKPRSPILDAARFWRAAASRAVVASGISAVIDHKRRSEAFTGAFLQDMAIPVLVDNVDGYDVLLKRWYDGDVDVADLAEAENEEFGWDHALVGSRMGAKWQFPDSLLNAVAHHHDHDDPDGMVGVQIVSGWHEIDEEASRNMVLERATLAPELQEVDVEMVVDEALDRVGEVSALFS